MAKFYMCDYCQKQLKIKDNLRVHMLKNHHPVTKTVRYKCKVCQRKFRHRSNLVVHFRDKHGIERGEMESKIEAVRVNSKGKLKLT